MVFDQSVPTTPTPIPTTFSVLDIDHERRIRREQLKELQHDDDQPHDAPPFLPLGATRRTKKRSSASYALPILLGVERPTKKRFLVTPPSADDLRPWRRLFFSDYNDDSLSDEENSFYKEEELPNFPSSKNDVDLVDLQKESEDKRSTNAISWSNWDEPVRELRPRKLRFLINLDDASNESKFESRSPDSSAFLPYMPL